MTSESANFLKYYQILNNLKKNKKTKSSAIGNQNRMVPKNYLVFFLLKKSIEIKLRSCQENLNKKKRL